MAKDGIVRIAAIRHPPFDDSGKPGDGPLTPDGLKRAEQLAEFFAHKLGGTPPLVFQSKYLRTAQLAQEICRLLGCTPQTAGWLMYGPTLDELVDACEGHEEVILCTHLPCIRAIAELAGAAADTFVGRGEVVVFRLDTAKRTLRWVGREAD